MLLLATMVTNKGKKSSRLYPKHLRKDMVEDFNDLKNECIKGVKD